VGSRQHRRVAIAALAPPLALGLALAACAGRAPGGTPAIRTTAVERVIDGDTIVVTGGERVRLIGIDTPETVDPRRPVECYGEQASARAEELMPRGTSVRLELDVERTDRYGRTLAYVHRADDDLFVNVELARGGYAEQLTVPPDVAHAGEIGDAVAQARREQRGLWAPGACG
jgi:micrococcal nuclease